MSSAVLPTLIGLTWDIKKRPMFSNLVQRSANLREVRVMIAEYPIYEWDLTYDVLREDTVNVDLNTLLGFFKLRYGNWDTFLFDDTSDDLTTDQAIATGDGSTVAFQLVRTQGGFAEPVYDIKTSSPTPSVKDNGSTVNPANYTINSTTGVLTFNSAPANGHAITATFGYYWRVRFKDSMSEFNRFMENLWENQQMTLVSVLP